MRFITEEAGVVVRVNDGRKGFVDVGAFGKEESVGVDDSANSILEVEQCFGAGVFFGYASCFLEEVEVYVCGRGEA